jgi:hypothetical protein
VRPTSGSEVLFRDQSYEDSKLLSSSQAKGGDSATRYSGSTEEDLDNEPENRDEQHVKAKAKCMLSALNTNALSLPQNANLPDDRINLSP